MKTSFVRFGLGVAALGALTQFSVLTAQDGPPRQGQRPDMFKMSDENGDGKVSLEEMLSGREKMMARRGEGPQRRQSEEGEGQARRGPDPEEMKARMSEAFAKADADGDGFLTREEFGQLRGGRRGAPEGEGRKGDGEGRKRKGEDS